MQSSVSLLPKAVAISTSQAWDNDGAGIWSTFILNVGTPPQPAKVLISTVGYATWVVVDQGCRSEIDHPGDCATARGNIFSIANSTSWIDVGIFELALEAGLGLGGNGQFGRDTVALGYTGSGGPKLDKQIVAGIADTDYYLGLFGIDPSPSNFTTLNEPQASYMWHLRNQSVIPSLSWGYTAGAAYRYDKVQGSLTLGGYDSSRFSAKNLTFPFYEDIQRRYVVGVNSVIYTPAGLTSSTSPVTLMPQKISMLIDSTTPYIWLPETACDRFASAFGLQYDPVHEIYTLNSTGYKRLQDISPTITFTISNNGGNTLDISMPYGAFDLNATFPVIRNETRYFPLKRANSTNQYVLGRTFLQEAYLIADHDRNEFTLAPCVWPGTFVSSIESIYPPGVSPPSNGTNGTITIVPKASSDSSLPLGPVIGGVVGGVVAIILATLAFYFFYYKPRQNTKPVELPGSESAGSDTAHNSSASQLGSTLESRYKHGNPDNPELAGMYAGAELPDIYSVERKMQGELLGTPVATPNELPVREAVGTELDSPEVFEMAAREPVGRELGTETRPRDVKVGGESEYFAADKKHQTYYNP